MQFFDLKNTRIFGLKLYFFPRIRSLCTTKPKKTKLLGPKSKRKITDNNDLEDEFENRSQTEDEFSKVEKMEEFENSSETEDEFSVEKMEEFENSSDETEDEFSVEKILDKRFGHNGIGKKHASKNMTSSL